MSSKNWPSQTTILLSSLLLTNLVQYQWNPQKAIAQPIIPARDGTGTNVTSPDGSLFNINGGTGTGNNLFHSFEQFNLETGQTANFISHPNIENILGRINGNNPSLINGLITVTGANSHLFLMNPAGIVFGPNASLNVPASFTATTATGIGFGNNNWFEAIGNNNWSNLVGTPNAFKFENAGGGSIVNFGNLTVNSGENLTLLGGTIVNTGTLAAPQGNLNIQTVTGENLVRISQPGHLLSLEIAPLNSTSKNLNVLNPLSLPQLLTYTGIAEANSLEINSAGQVVLKANQLPVNDGDMAIFSPGQNTTITAGNATLQAAANLTLAETILQTTGDLNLLAGNSAIIRDGNFPFRAVSGGNLSIEAFGNIDILALNYPGAAFQALGDINLISDGVISGDARFAAGGNFSILNKAGGPGTFISFYDPIISSEGDVIFGDYEGVSLKVEAGGSISGVNITITGPDTNITDSTDPDVEILSNSPALILRSRVESLANPPNVEGTDTIVEGTSFEGTEEPRGSDITVASINIPDADGRVILESGGRAIAKEIITQGSIDVTAAETIIIADSVNAGRGAVRMNAGSEINLNSLETEGGDINLAADGNITIGS